MAKKRVTADTQKPLKKGRIKKSAIDMPTETIDISELYSQVKTILAEARLAISRKINTEMVRAYWLVGQAIVECEQKGKHRADYGKRVIESLAEKLVQESGKGFYARNLWWMREFYLQFPKLNALRSELSWTHYRLLLKVEKQGARDFYEQETAEQNWSTRCKNLCSSWVKDFVS